MSSEEYRAIRNQAQRLSTEEQFRLLEDLVAMLKKKSRPQHSILELKGLGKEVWEGVDVDEYIRQERDSWEPKNVSSQKSGADPLVNLGQERHAKSSSANLPRNIEMIPKNDELKTHSSSQNLSPQTSDYSVDDEEIKLYVMAIANTLKQQSRTGDIDNRGAQRELVERWLRELSALQNPENTDLESRDEGEKITQERDSWGG